MHNSMMTPNHAARALLLRFGPAATMIGCCIYQPWKQIAVSDDGVSLLIMIGAGLSAGSLRTA